MTFSTAEGKPVFDTKTPPAVFSEDSHALSAGSSSGSTHSEKIIAVGRLANVSKVGAKGNVSDTVIAKMIHDAKSAVFISQQAILPLFLKTKFNTTVVNEIAQAIACGIDVYILTSSTEEEFVGKGAFGYSSKYDREQTFAYFHDIMIGLGVEEPHTFQQLFKHLHVLPTGNRLHQVPNHAKVVIADANVSYIGSHNLYDDSHAEFGVVLGRFGSQELLTDYFSPLWHASLMLGSSEAPSEEGDEYLPGDYVYVHRSQSDRDNPSQDWTLGRVLETAKGGVTIDLDFLNGGKGGRVKPLVPYEEIRKAPGNPRDFDKPLKKKKRKKKKILESSIESSLPSVSKSIIVIPSDLTLEDLTKTTVNPLNTGPKKETEEKVKQDNY